MKYLYKRWDTPKSRFGDFMVIVFLVTQSLDGVFTYMGVRIWGLGIEANPIVSSAVSWGGLGVGLVGTKLVAIGLGIALHLCRVHNIIAVLTAIYVTFAILPWAAMFLLAP